MSHKLKFTTIGTLAGILLVVVSTIRSTAAAQITLRNKSEYSITNPKFNSIIVARVGPMEITAEEFLLSYESFQLFALFLPGRDKQRTYLQLQQAKPAMYKYY